MALVDDSPKGIGGTCLHVGCIPTKAMLESADLYDRIQHSETFGISVDGVTPTRRPSPRGATRS